MQQHFARADRKTKSTQEVNLHEPAFFGVVERELVPNFFYPKSSRNKISIAGSACSLSFSSPGPNGKRLLRNWMYAKRQARPSCGTAYGLLSNFSLSARRRLNIGSSPHMINLRGHKAQFSYLYVSRACIFFTSLCCRRTIMLRRRRPSESKQNFKKLLFKYANARWLAGFLWRRSPGSPSGSQSHSTRVHFRHDWNIFARQYTRAPNEASLMPSWK